MRIYVNPMFLRLLVCHAIPPKTKFPLSHLMIKRRSALCVMFRLVKNEIENLSRHKKEKKIPFLFSLRIFLSLQRFQILSKHTDFNCVYEYFLFLDCV